MMKNQIFQAALLGSLLLFAGHLTKLSAQVAQNGEQLNKEVEVVKPYTPDVADVRKISRLPRITDTVWVRPTFGYSLLSGVAPSVYRPVAASPVKILPPELPALYKGFARIGAANYSSPLVELFLHSGRSDSREFGASVRHASSFGKISLGNGIKQRAPFGTTALEGFARRYLPISTLSADAGFSHQFVSYYGVNPLLFSTDPPILEMPLSTGKIGQNFWKGWLSGSIQSRPREGFNYLLSLQSSVLNDKFGYFENVSKMAFLLGSSSDRLDWGMEGDVELFFRNKDFEPMPRQMQNYSLVPYFRIRNEEIDVKAGVRTTLAGTEGDHKFYLFPKVNLDLMLGGPSLHLFGILGGGVQTNFYTSILEKNPFVYPGQISGNSIEYLDALAGIRGDVGSVFQFRFGVGYAIWKDYLFFANIDAPDQIDTWADNAFVPVLDDMNRFMVNSEFSVTWTDFLSSVVGGNIYHWDTDQLPFAPHMPDWDLSLSVKYQYDNRFFATLQGTAMGERTAFSVRSFDGADTPALPLDSEIDLNLLLKYQLNDRFGLFLNGYNLSNHKQYLWNFFPSQGLQIQGGVTITF